LELIDGHLRQEVMGDQPVPVLIVDVTEEEADKMLLTYDPLAMMAHADQDQLLQLLRDTQFESKAVNAMLEAVANGERLPMPDLHEPVEDPGPQIDHADELREKWQTERGQVWEVGRHRLMCGDATSAEDVAETLKGASPPLMVTDPPYGVNLDQGWRDRRGLNGLGHAQDDQLAGDDSADWSDAWIMSPAEIAYVWSAAGALQLVTGAALQKAGFELRQQIVWVKTMAPLSRSAYHWKHEPCWYAVRKGATAHWRGGHAETTIWEAASPKHIMGGSEEIKENHPTQKPLLCMARPIRNHEGDVYDPFLGSGTTMVAAEQLGRICYGMEIEPKYVAVTLERLAGMGLEPKLVTG
jgi:DNA modification methylase